MAARLAELRATSEPKSSVATARPRLRQSEPTLSSTGDEGAPEALLRIPTDAVDRLLELLERVYLAHDELRGTGQAARRLAMQLRDEAWNPIHKQLLSYLVTDEEKHDSLLEALDEIKVGMNKASGG